MAKFFFNVLNDVSTTTDKGVISRTLGRRLSTRKVIGEILAEELQEQNNAIHLSVLIEDADHVRVANIKCVTTIVESTGPFVA